MSTLKLTLEQVKNEVKPDTRIYYSSGSLWWTHKAEDVAEATIMGLATQSPCLTLCAGCVKNKTMDDIMDFFEADAELQAAFF